MKKVIWRPKAVSRPAMILIALGSVIGMLLLEVEKNTGKLKRRPYYQEKIEAAEMAQRAFQEIYSARTKIREINPEYDPLETGLIGVNISTVTSVNGVLPAKQTAANPNFAAVVVDMLREAGVKEGDYVGVGLSGSFPALNICTVCAIETLRGRTAHHQ